MTIHIHGVGDYQSMVTFLERSLLSGNRRSAVEAYNALNRGNWLSTNSAFLCSKSPQATVESLLRLQGRFLSTRDRINLTQTVQRGQLVSQQVRNRYNPGIHTDIEFLLSDLKQGTIAIGAQYVTGLRRQGQHAFQYLKETIRPVDLGSEMLPRINETFKYVFG